MVNEVLGGKDHLAVFVNEYSPANPPDNTTWSYPGILKEPKLSPGLQLNTLTGLGSRYPLGWSKEGYIPELSISGQVAGPRFYNVLEPHLKESLNENYSTQAWEIYRDKGDGYNGALVVGAVAKSISLSKTGYANPLEFSLGLIGRMVQLTETFSGGTAQYVGFKGSASNPLNIAHPEPEPIPWLGVHVEERLKYAGESYFIPALIRNWTLQITREITPYVGRVVGDDGNKYTVPRAMSWQKATATMSITLGAQDWEPWKRSYEGTIIDYLDL